MRKTLTSIVVLALAVILLCVVWSIFTGDGESSKPDAANKPPAGAKPETPGDANDPTSIVVPVAKTEPTVKQFGILNNFTVEAVKETRHIDRMAVKSDWSELVDVGAFNFNTHFEEPVQILINSGRNNQRVVEVNNDGKWLIKEDGSREKVAELASTGVVNTLRFKSVGTPTKVVVTLEPKY